MSHTPTLVVEEHVHGETVWVAVRARGADWSWLTEEEALALAYAWLAKYGPTNVAERGDTPTLRVVSG